MANKIDFVRKKNLFLLFFDKRNKKKVDDLVVKCVNIAISNLDNVNIDDDGMKGNKKSKTVLCLM